MLLPHPVTLFALFALGVVLLSGLLGRDRRPGGAGSAAGRARPDAPPTA
jgi:hypothetical protein